MSRYDWCSSRCLVIQITQNSLYDLVADCALELSQGTGQCYTTYTEESEQDDPEVIIMVVENESNSCFHIAITGTNTDIENAKAVCSQAILDRSSEDDSDLFYSVYDSLTRTVFYCLCSPSMQEFEDVSCNSMQGEADQVAEWLKAYIVVNAESLASVKWDRQDFS
jgi:malonyl CoA-acyl carrier protein transacylase